MTRKSHNQTEFLNRAIHFLKEKQIDNPLEEHPLTPHKYTASGCPGAKIMDFRNRQK